MKKISPAFLIISILLSIAGICGAAATIWLTVSNSKNGEALNALSVIALILGLVWSIGAVVTGIAAFRQAKKITLLQRNVSQNKLDPRYSKTAKKAYRARLNYKQCRIRAILILSLCVLQMVFTCILGVKIAFIIFVAVCGIVVPFFFLASAKSNS